MNHRAHVSSPARYLKVVDGDKIWEEGQDVLDLQQVTLVQKLHGSANVLLILHHMASWNHTQWAEGVTNSEKDPFPPHHQLWDQRTKKWAGGGVERKSKNKISFFFFFFKPSSLAPQKPAYQLRNTAPQMVQKQFVVKNKQTNLNGPAWLWSGGAKDKKTKSTNKSVTHKQTSRSPDLKMNTLELSIFCTVFTFIPVDFTMNHISRQILFRPNKGERTAKGS